MENHRSQIGEFEEIDPVIAASPRLCAVLQSLSLVEYTEVLVAHGFTTWDRLLHIQEHDLEAMKFKLGHRRKLQREIAVRSNVQRLQDQLESPQDGTELATIHGSSAIRQEKRRIEEIDLFQGMHKRYVLNNVTTSSFKAASDTLRIQLPSQKMGFSAYRDELEIWQI